MIAKLKGLIDSTGQGWAVIDVGGVGYLVFCSSRTLGHFNVGDVTGILVETHVREDHIHLYGFCDALERDWFKLLTTVQGVGVKVALGMLGVLSPEQLVQAVAVQDKTMITQAPGVGSKLATRILSELKDKVESIVMDANLGGIVQGGIAPNREGGGALTDAVSALVNLGYQPSQALSAVSRAASKMDEGVAVEILIRGGLNELAPANNKGGS
jgi:Holliday junction DNA helicase RuvA